MDSKQSQWRHGTGAALALAAAVLIPAVAAAQQPEQPPAVTVTATGQVEREPDRAVVQLAVEREAPTAEEAMGAASAAMEQVLAAVRGEGIPGERSRTTGLQLRPVYRHDRDRPQEQPRIVGYSAYNAVRVTVDELVRTGQVIDAALGAGANRVDGVFFELRDAAAARAAALEDAVARARSEAETLAAALGHRLGPVLDVRTTAEPIRPLAVPMARMDVEVAAAPPPVEPGLLDVRADVIIVFRLDPI